MQPTAFRNSPGPMFESWVTQHPPPAMIDALPESVAIVEINDGKSLERLAGALKLQGVSGDASQPWTLRPLHAKLLERLRLANARAVVFDLRFRKPTEADGDFAAAIAQMTAANIPVVSAMPTLDASSVSPVLASQLRLAADIVGVPYGAALLGHYLAIEPPGAAPVPSFALATSIALYRQDADAAIQIDEAANQLEVRFFVPDAANPRKRNWLSDRWSMPLARVTHRPQADARLGIVAGSRLAEAQLPMPSDTILRAARMDYASVFDQDLAAVQKRIGGRVVVVADGRPGMDPTLDIGAGRKIPGYCAVAASIHAAIRGGWVQIPSSGERLLFIAVTCALTAALGASARPRLFRGIAILAFVLVIAMLIGFIAFRVLGVLLNPIPAAIGAFVTGAIGLIGRRLFPTSKPLEGTAE